MSLITLSVRSLLELPLEFSIRSRDENRCWSLRQNVQVHRTAVDHHRAKVRRSSSSEIDLNVWTIDQRPSGRTTPETRECEIQECVRWWKFCEWSWWGFCASVRPAPCVFELQKVLLLVRESENCRHLTVEINSSTAMQHAPFTMRRLLRLLLKKMILWGENSVSGRIRRWYSMNRLVPSAIGTY